ncbi:hypothetical protein D9M71_814800 [compost metagenome]
MRIDIGFDAVRAFVAIGQATDGGGLADTLDAVAAAQTQNHQALLLHGVHRQLVRADGRQVDNNCINSFN